MSFLWRIWDGSDDDIVALEEYFSSSRRDSGYTAQAKAAIARIDEVRVERAETRAREEKDRIERERRTRAFKAEAAERAKKTYGQKILEYFRHIAYYRDEEQQWRARGNSLRAQEKSRAVRKTTTDLCNHVEEIKEKYGDDGSLEIRELLVEHLSYHKGDAAGLRGRPLLEYLFGSTRSECEDHVGKLHINAISF